MAPMRRFRRGLLAVRNGMSRIGALLALAGGGNYLSPLHMIILLITTPEQGVSNSFLANTSVTHRHHAVTIQLNRGAEHGRAW